MIAAFKPHLKPDNMKKFLFLFIAVVFIAIACKKNTLPGYTILGDYTPYAGFIEKMNGKVKTVAEKMYWTIADGDTIQKGNPVTIKDRDSLKWYYDYEASFDSIGNLMHCLYLDENNKAIGSYVFTKENNVLSSAIGMYRDTIRENQKLKCDEKGIIIEVKAYKPGVDSLMYSYTINYNKPGDTVLYLGYNSKGIFNNKVLNLYNEKGQFLCYEVYDKDGVLTSSDKVTYNDKGKASEFTFYGKDKKVSQEAKRTYTQFDSKGNWTVAITKDEKGRTVISERNYVYYD
jgi:hypothetical protein